MRVTTFLSSHQGGEGLGWYRMGTRHVYLCGVPEARNVVIVVVKWP
jgi:hypothetical protein